ncbi:hypothetical protein [Devosia sp. CAU 1758]
MTKIFPCLWFDNNLKEAIEFYRTLLEWPSRQWRQGKHVRLAKTQIRPELANYPEALYRTVGGSDPKGANRAMQAMLQMRKIDIAAIEKAYAGV